MKLLGYEVKKRDLAHIYWSIVIPSSVIIWDNGVPETPGKIIAVLGVIFTAVGYGHAGVKAKKKKT